MKEILLVIVILQSLIRRRAWKPLMAGCTSSELATRKNPSPFNIIKMESEMFQNVTEHMKVLYKTFCPIPTRPIREVVFEEAHPRLLRYRENWNGAYSTAVISKPVGTRTRARQVPLTPLYSGKLPISEAKYADLQVLKTFCSLQAQQFYDDQFSMLGGMLILMSLIWTVPLLRIEKYSLVTLV